MGNYSVGLKKLGTSHLDKTMEEFMGEKHKGMLEVQEVPGRTEILFHPGNSIMDLLGCLAPGDSYDKDSTVGSGNQDKTYWLHSSRLAYARIYPGIAEAVLDLEGVRIEITEAFLVAPKGPELPLLVTTEETTV
jgi:hypothetical protein